MDGIALGVDRHGHRHVLHLELVDRLHAQVGEGEHPGGTDGLRDEVGRAADRDQVYPLVAAVRDEAVGPAGPTTSRRMDRFLVPMLAHTGLLGSIGKSERGAEGLEALRRHGGVHLIAVGGAAYLVARAVRSARVIAFPDLGMEAIQEFQVKDMPVTVAVDASGNAIHESGPREWRARIGKIPVRGRDGA